ncbi:MAG: LysM peptidoglycan-binding protein [Gammaproteobacteria bacterium]|nr:LysM peptidoglycan-binding protein [Gammaproteobacteria bacterium]
MNSTWGKAIARAGLERLLLGGVLVLLAATRALAAEDPMPRPPELERDVQFWIRIYSEVDTNGGFLHDERNLGVVYEKLHFAPNTSPREREKILDQGKVRYTAALRRIAAANGGPLSEEDQRILDMWGSEGTPARLLEATDEIRFQLGQSDRFRAGLIRSGAWETHIAETLANLGLPAELAVLPHVESSFNPAAYSKVGAAGLWQFMRSTGRRYMRIDNAVDDRLDPFRATEAAAQLLAYNYRLLGSWPLALTAYNHGAEGVRRAKETLGTDDIVRIVRTYKGRTFGFASRNFYVSFLAALEIDRNPEKYFGGVERASEARFQEVTVPGFVQMSALERALRIDRQRLRELNPALLRSVWDGQRHVPKAYHLRLPMDGDKWTSDLLAARLSPGDFFAGQPEPRRYRVRRGDTVASVADQYGVTAEALARLNRVRTSGKLKVGRVINLPESTAGTLVAAAGAPAGSIAVGRPGTTATLAANASGSAGRSGGTSVTSGIGVLNGGAANGSTATTGADSAAASGGAGTSILNGIVAGGSGTTANGVPSGVGAEVSGSTSGTNTRSGAAGTANGINTGPRRGIISSPSGVYVVQTGESLADIASKFGMTEAQLLKLNGIRNRDFIFEGQQLLVTATPPSAVASTGGPGTGVPSAASAAAPAKTFEGGASGAPVASTAVPSTNVPSRERLTGASAPDTSPVPVVAAGAVPIEEAARESVEEAHAVAKAGAPAQNAQPVNAAQAEELSPALGPSADTQQNADPTDYSVSKDNTIRVAAAETLGHYADWLRVSAGRLRQLNRMSFAKPVLIGHKIKLEFGRVSREEFETKRREYHAELQATYFAEHRIIGTEVYIVRRGDALWTVTQRFAQLPIWLLQQYNPDVDLADLHPGTQIVMPRVENVVGGPG